MNKYLRPTAAGLSVAITPTQRTRKQTLGAYG